MTEEGAITLLTAVIRDYQQGELASIIHAERILNYEGQTVIEQFSITSLLDENPYEGSGEWLSSKPNLVLFKNVVYQSSTHKLTMQDGLLELSANRLTTPSSLTIEQNNLKIQASSLIWHLDKQEMFLTQVIGQQQESTP